MITQTFKKYILSRIIPVNGVLYVNNNTTAQSIPAGSTYTKLLLDNLIIAFTKHIDVNATTRNVTILKKGKYQLAFNFSSISGTNNIILETVLLKNDVEIPSMHIKRQFSGLAVISHATMTDIIELEKGDILRIAVKHDNAAAVNLTVQYANMSVHRI